MANFNQGHNQWQNIPQELRNLNQWCVADPNKAPHTPTDGLPYAKVNDPSTWHDFETACHYARLYNMQIGFMLSANDPYLIIDLDVKKDTPQEVIAGFHNLIRRFDCYTEHSVSGRGFHIVARGNIGAGKRREGIEIYSYDRFMIFTGNVVNDRPIKEQSELLAQLLSTLEHTQHISIELNALDFESDDPQGRTATDIALIATSNQDELGQLFRGHWQGRQYPSQSEADLAFITELGLISPSNKVCLEVFRMSALGQRAKASRDDYIVRTFSIARERVYHSQKGKEFADAIFKSWHEKQQKNSFGRFQILSEQDLFNIPPPKWLVKNVIPERGIGSIYGESGSGKSFLTLDLLAHIANGKKWFGRKVTRVPALYIPLEGQAGIPNRIKAWSKYCQLNPDWGINSTNLEFIFDSLDLRKSEDRQELLSALKKRQWQNGVLCIDTLAQSAPGADENSSTDMGEVISALNKIQQELSCLILIIHHTGKDKSRGMRGWSGTLAAMDFALECQGKIIGAKTFERDLVMQKVKDAEIGKPIRFALIPITLGVDEDGEKITSLTVRPYLDDSHSSSESTPSYIYVDKDNDFVYEWVKKEVDAGKYPSKNTLKKQLPEMKRQWVGTYKITQQRLSNAIERLLSSELLIIRESAPTHHNTWVDYNRDEILPKDDIEADTSSGSPV